MWVLVLFDLPSETKSERKAHSEFRKSLLKDGFIMFQYSIYIRHCLSAENAKVHIKRVKDVIPSKGHIVLLSITDKQFGDMEIFYGQKEKCKKEDDSQQLFLF